VLPLRGDYREPAWGVARLACGLAAATWLESEQLVALAARCVRIYTLEKKLVLARPKCETGEQNAERFSESGTIKRRSPRQG